jgi:hypothetical protein
MVVEWEAWHHRAHRALRITPSGRITPSDARTVMRMHVASILDLASTVCMSLDEPPNAWIIYPNYEIHFY